MHWALELAFRNKDWDLGTLEGAREAVHRVQARGSCGAKLRMNGERGTIGDGLIG